MQGTVSFIPVDVATYDDLIQPLMRGEKVNPGGYLRAALQLREASWPSARCVALLENYLERLTPEAPPSEGKLWDRVRARLERLDFRPEPLARLVGEHIDPEVHLEGRPFFVTEGSAHRVAMVIDDYIDAARSATVGAVVREQLIRLNRELGSSLPTIEDGAPTSHPPYRTQLLDGLKRIFDLCRAARDDEIWTDESGHRGSAQAMLPRELPWLTALAVSRATPCWSAKDVDGLATVCRAAGLEPPRFLVPAWRLFGDACETHAGLREALAAEISGNTDVGSYVSAQDVPQLLAFLSSSGSRIIQVAARHGEGAACTDLLRKVRECARYAEAHGRAYLEASGIPPIVDPELVAQQVLETA